MAEDRTLRDRVLKQKSHFSQYNIVRMREAIRYLSPRKLELFIKIPVMIHEDRPELPGFVNSQAHAHGIHHFEKSGFFRAAVERNLLSGRPGQPPNDPAVLGLYHIGSLGTFTQSVGSDFDYWLIIDKHNFSEQRLYELKKKINGIVKHSREAFDQEVTFFIMDMEDIRCNRYAALSGKETLSAPRIFLKEEFYRTFLMIAGKIPYWAILPDTDCQKTYDGFIRAVPGTPGLASVAAHALDLGHAALPDVQDMLKAILFHIAKSRSDPVKALIKATMAYSFGMGDTVGGRPMCNDIKAGYADAGIDDYRVDPYKILFDRIIAFHKTHEPDGLSLVKNAIFFRLCGYPRVAEPETGSPKRQLLDRYIREWNLEQSRVNKMLAYETWAESEKMVLERTILKRLSAMYQRLIQKAGANETFARQAITDTRSFRILTHKASERLKTAKHKLMPCSTFLRRQKLMIMLLTRKRFSGWHLTGFDHKGRETQKLFRSDLLLGLMGWILENQLYDRSKATLKLDVPQRLFGSHDTPVDPDKLYLMMQPLKPLSDDSFSTQPTWVKLVVLLIYTPDNRLEKAEFLAANTWGELFVRGMDINSLENKSGMEDNYRQIAQKIAAYNTPGLRTFVFQLSLCHDPEAAYRIKQYLGIPDAVKQKIFGKTPKNRPLLDSL